MESAPLLGLYVQTRVVHTPEKAPTETVDKTNTSSEWVVETPQVVQKQEPTKGCVARLSIGTEPAARSDMVLRMA